MRDRLERIFAGLSSWLPPMELGPGQVDWPGGSLQLRGAVWKGDTFTIRDLSFGSQVADVSVLWDRRSHSADDPAAGARDLVVTAVAKTGEWSLRARAERREIVASLSVLDQPVSLTAQFDEQGWLPAAAKVDAARWTLPAKRVHLDPGYATVSGDAHLVWKDSGLSVSVDAQADPTPGNAAPGLRVAAKASGDLTRLRVEQLEVVGPGVTARLSQPVVVRRDGTLESTDSRFDVVGDLAKQPWFKAAGSWNGQVVIHRNDDGKVRVEGTLAGRDLAGATWAVPKAQASAVLVWPRLEVTEASLRWPEGDDLSVKGAVDLRARQIEFGRVQGRVPRSVVARWIPENWQYERLEIALEASGPWSGCSHRGKVTAQGVRWTDHGWKPLELAAEWQGRGSAIEQAEVTAGAGEGRVRAAARVDPAAHEAAISSLRLERAGQLLLGSTSPFTVHWGTAPRVDSLRLSGPEAQITVSGQGGVGGRIDVEAAGIVPALWRDFYVSSDLGWTLRHLTLKGQWQTGPMVASLAAEGSMELSSNLRAEVVLSARSGPDGVEVDQAEVSLGGDPILTATATLPASVQAGDRWQVSFDRDKPLKVDLTTQRSPAFWQRVGELTQVHLEDPEVRVAVGGTWRAPKGEAQIKVARAAFGAKEAAEGWPMLEKISASIVGDGERVNLRPFSAEIAGQAVQGEASLPLPASGDMRSSQELREWVRTHLQARLEIPEADLAAVAKIAPKWVAPTGRAQVSLAVAPPMRVTGLVRIRDASTRPLGPLGVLQEVTADLEFKQQRLEVERVEARAGGQPVTLTGWAELADGEGLRLNLALRGKNLPFVRQAGLLLRGDVDLQVASVDRHVIKVSGKTTLRDSLFLTDVRSLIPRGGPRSAPGRRPPYFSVTAPPFSAWLLDVEVSGPRFLRIRAPLMTGVASAHFQLSGTLAEPRALGEATVDEGQISLPFATLSVQQGEVTLTQADPFDPRIDLVAVSRRLGYDVRMELAGTASNPSLTFSSSPPLSSEQVLLMVMAGESPQNEITFSGSQRAMRLGTYLGQSLLGQIGTDTDRAERFSLSVGERVSRDGRETYALEYPLNSRWSLVGEYDEFDDYNIGMKWRAFVHDPAAEKKKAAAQGKPTDLAPPAEPSAATPKSGEGK